MTNNLYSISDCTSSNSVTTLQFWQPRPPQLNVFKYNQVQCPHQDNNFTFFSLFPPFSGFVFAWTRTSQKGHLHLHLHFYTKSITCNLIYTNSSICNFFHTKSRPWKRRRFFLSRRASTLTPILPTSSAYISSHLCISSKDTSSRYIS